MTLKNRSQYLITFYAIFLIFRVGKVMAAKLYFRYGVVNSAKTLNLLAVAHSYQQQGKSVLLLKPELDTRFGAEMIQSKAGLQQKADVLIKKNTDLIRDISASQRNVKCILVDEVQFLDPAHINQLREIVTKWEIPVIAYGLRTDFRTNFFPGSLRLMEVADNIEEIKTTCHFCTKKAIFSLKHVNGVPDCTGPSVQLGALEKYFATCAQCYTTKLLL